MKNRWLRAMNIFLSGFLVILGFSACDSSEPDDPSSMLLMYGMPPVSFELKGKVVNNEKLPVSDIQIIIKENQLRYTGRADTLYTDKSGKFYYKSYSDSETFWLIHRDLRNQDIVYKTDSVLFKPEKWSEEVTLEIIEKKQDE